MLALKKNTNQRNIKSNVSKGKKRFHEFKTRDVPSNHKQKQKEGLKQIKKACVIILISIVMVQQIHISESIFKPIL